MNKTAANKILRTVLGPKRRIVWQHEPFLWRHDKSSRKVSIDPLFLQSNAAVLMSIANAIVNRGSGKVATRWWVQKTTTDTWSGPAKRPSGKRAHDLNAVMDRVVKRFGLKRATVAWASRAHEGWIAQYSPSDKHIEFNPALDSKDVPDYVIFDTMHHEMCHHAHPVFIRAGMMSSREANRLAHDRPWQKCAHRGAEFKRAHVWLRTAEGLRVVWKGMVKHGVPQSRKKLAAIREREIREKSYPVQPPRKRRNGTYGEYGKDWT